MLCHLWASERSIRHALPYIPNLARVIAEYRDCLKSASCLVGFDLEFSLACLHSDSSSFLDQRSQRDSMGVGLECRPLHFREGITHCGSIKSLSQASAVFSDRIDLKTDDRTLANAGLAFLGTKRRVGLLSSHTTSREGKLDVVGSESAAGTGPAVVEGETCVSIKSD